MFNVKHLFNKKLFRLAIAVVAFLVIIVASNLQIDTVNTNQFQTGQKISLVKTISQNETVSPTNKTAEQNKVQKSSDVTQKEEYLISAKDVAFILMGVLIGSLTLLLYVFSPVIKTKEGDFPVKAEFINAVFPRVVEGITVILIVIVVTLLSLVDKINPQGAISILSALVGYVLGKQTGGGDGGPNPQQQQPPGGGDGGPNPIAEITATEKK